MEGAKTATSSCECESAGDLNDASHVADTTVVPMQGDPNRPDPSSKCSQQELQDALSVLEGKWKALIICELLEKDRRYHELEKALDYISRRILTYELRFLEKKGIVQRSYSDSSPRGVEYSLTARGRALNGVIVELVSWARTVDTM
jgi:DNA-binding HxlR family transcriptional regulator